MKVFARVGYQPSRQLTCDVATTSIEQLKKLAAETLSVDVSVASFALVSQGRDVLALSGSNPDVKDQSVAIAKVITDAPIVILAITFPNTKPIRRRQPKVEASEVAAAGDSKDKFAGLTPENALSQLDAAKDKKKRDVILSYIDMYTNKILETKTATKVSKAGLAAILERDGLTSKEGELFDWVIKWGKAQSSAAASDAKELAKATADVIGLVRFPLMTTKEVAMKVSPLGVLSVQQQLELFSYIGQKEGGGSPPLGESISKFKTEKRKGAGFTEIIWDYTQSFTSSCYTHVAPKTAFKNRSGFIAVLREQNTRNSGFHRFRLTWEGIGAENAWSNGRDGIGFVLDTYNCSSYYLASGTGACCYDPYRRQVYIDSAEQPGTLPSLAVGTVMEFSINIDKGEVIFFGQTYNWPGCIRRNLHVALCFNAEGWRFTTA